MNFPSQGWMGEWEDGGRARGHPLSAGVAERTFNLSEMLLKIAA